MWAEMQGGWGFPHVEFLMLGDPVAVRAGLARAMRVPPLRDLARGDRETAELVLAEVLNNIAEHAYGSRQGPVTLSFERGSGGLSCRIEDEGGAMPGNRLPLGTLPEAGALAEGGYGWHLIRALTRDLCYERMGLRNRLSFTLVEGQ